MAEIESDVKVDPLFSFKNFFKPTTKNVLLWGTGIKAACATLIGFATTVVSSNVPIGVLLIVVGLLLGFLADTFIALTREKPTDTLIQAVVDVKEEVIENQHEN